jgi:DNA-directed RNA polymerase subunit RPC12/RpoP
MELRTLKVADNAIDIHILRSRLETDGITCFVFDEQIVSVNPLYNITVGGIKLKVRSEQYEKAAEILREIGDTPYTDDAGMEIRCPKCNSVSLQSGFRSVKGIRGFISMITAFFFTVFPIGLRSVWRCNQCGHEFRTGKDQ